MEPDYRTSFSSDSSQIYQQLTQDGFAHDLPTVCPMDLLLNPWDSNHPPPMMEDDWSTSSPFSQVTPSQGPPNPFNEQEVNLLSLSPSLFPNATLSGIDYGLAVGHYNDPLSYDGSGLQFNGACTPYPLMPLDPSQGLGIYTQPSTYPELGNSDLDYNPFIHGIPPQEDYTYNLFIDENACQDGLLQSFTPVYSQAMDTAPTVFTADTEFTPPLSQLATPPIVPSSQDANLIEGRRQGLTYKQIKERYNMHESESTLRGRHRSLTKPKEQRVRRPKWTPKDVSAPEYRSTLASRASRLIIYLIADPSIM